MGCCDVHAALITRANLFIGSECVCTVCLCVNPAQVLPHQGSPAVGGDGQDCCSTPLLKQPSGLDGESIATAILITKAAPTAAAATAAALRCYTEGCMHTWQLACGTLQNPQVSVHGCFLAAW